MRKEPFIKISRAEVTTVPTKSGFYDLIVNNWWAVTEDDCILLYGKSRSRQCNSNKSIADHFVKIETHPATKAMLLKTVFLPHDCGDYV